MDIFRLSDNRQICYNSTVPQKRDELIFDIGGRPIAPAVGPKPTVWWRDLTLPHQEAKGKTSCKLCRQWAAERGVEESHPGLRHIRNSVLKLPGNHYYSRMRRKYGVAPCGNHAAQPLSSASSRLVVVPLGNRVSRVRRFLFVPKWRCSVE